MIASWKTLGFQDRVLEKAWFSRPQMAVQDLRSLLLRSPLGGTDDPSEAALAWLRRAFDEGGGWLPGALQDLILHHVSDDGGVSSDDRLPWMRCPSLQLVYCKSSVCLGGRV